MTAVRCKCLTEARERTPGLLARPSTKGDCLMRQLHIREPWATLAAGSEQQLLVELMDRIQVLENRMRTLEGRVEERLEPEPVGVS